MDCVLTAEHPALGKRHEVVRIGTRLGDILVFLFDETPQHKRAFLQLCADGYWSQWAFNRVIKDFVIQAGTYECLDLSDSISNIADSVRVRT